MPSSTPMSNETRIHCLRKRNEALEKRIKFLEAAIANNAPSMWQNSNMEVSRLEGRLREKHTQLEALRTANETLTTTNNQQAVLLQWHREDEEARISARRCPCCLADFGEATVPVVIHCGHSLCQDCARRLARPVPHQPNHPPRDHLLTCPECRQHGYFRPNHMRRNYALVHGIIMAQASVLAQLEAVSAELQLMYARNNHLVIALDEQSRISLHRLEYIRMMQDNSTTVIELQATVNDLQAKLVCIEQREDLLAGQLGRSLEREAALQEELQQYKK